MSIYSDDSGGDSYNEMMAHVPLFLHPNPKRVLVIGGGDGYVLSEVLKHNSVVHVDHVDLDGDVIDVCKQFFKWGGAWDDPRAQLHIADGAQFVREAADGTYDVIIQDSSDPWAIEDDGSMTPLPSGVLYREDHFRNLHRILSPNGVLNLQAESFNMPSSLQGISDWRKLLMDCGFGRSRYGGITISSYTTGHIGFLCSQKGSAWTMNYGDVKRRYERMVARGNRTTYYHPPLQRGAFDIPLWAQESIYGQDPPPDVCEDESYSMPMFRKSDQ